MRPDECANGLIRLLDAQAAICRWILEKSGQQRELVAQMREDDLLALLADKQRLIEQQQKLADEARPFLDEWEKSARAVADPSIRARAEAVWNGLRDLLDRIVKLEDESRAKLEEQKGRMSIDIGSLQRGKIVNKAYGGGLRPPTPAHYSDRRG
jgi:hypothetical protein